MIVKIFTFLFKVALVFLIMLGSGFGYKFFTKEFPKLSADDQNMVLVGCAIAICLIIFWILRQVSTSKGRNLLWKGFKLVLVTASILFTIVILNTEVVSDALSDAFNILKGIAGFFAFGYVCYLFISMSNDPESQAVMRRHNQETERQRDTYDRKRLNALESKHRHSGYELSDYEKNEYVELKNRLDK